MANHKSALKRVRQTKTRTDRNRFYRTRMKNIIKAVVTAIDEKDVAKAEEAFKKANKELHKLVSKNILHKNTAARKVSRLATKINQLKKEAAA